MDGGGSAQSQVPTRLRRKCTDHLHIAKYGRYHPHDDGARERHVRARFFWHWSTTARECGLQVVVFEVSPRDYERIFVVDPIPVIVPASPMPATRSLLCSRIDADAGAVGCAGTSLHLEGGMGFKLVGRFSHISCPFLLLQGKGVAGTTGTADVDSAELLLQLN